MQFSITHFINKLYNERNLLREEIKLMEMPIKINFWLNIKQ